MYQIINPTLIARLADGAFIPRDADNPDYRTFLAWEAAGNTVLPAAPPPPLTQGALDVIAAGQYPKLVALRNMTPVDVQAWVELNVTNLATAKDAIKTLAVAICVLARRL